MPKLHESRFVLLNGIDCPVWFISHLHLDRSYATHGCSLEWHLRVLIRRGDIVALHFWKEYRRI